MPEVWYHSDDETGYSYKAESNEKGEHSGCGHFGR